MKKIFLLLLSFCIGLALFIWILRTVGWQEIKNSFLVFSGFQGMLILFLTFLTALIGTWKLREILKSQGAEVPFRNVWRAYLAGFSIRFLMPIIVVGAELFQGYAFKKENSVPWSQGMAAIIIDRILELTVNLAVVFSGGLFFFSIIGLSSLKLIMISGGLFSFFLVGICFFYFKAFKKESILKIFSKLLNNKLGGQPAEIEKEIFAFFKLRNRIKWKIFSLNFLKAGVMLLRTWLLLAFLDRSASFLPALAVLGFTYLAVMIPIPTALGSHEVIQTFAFSPLGLKAATATAFTMIIRGAELIVALFGIIILFRFGLFLIKDAFFSRISNFANRSSGS